MKLRITFYLITLCCILGNNAKAQQPTTAAAYPFSASIKPFSYLVGGTAPGLTSGNADDGYISNIPIGFTFKFCTTTYTTITACTNGWLGFGNIASSTFSNAASGIPGPTVMAMWDDNDCYVSSSNTAYNNSISYATIGSPGSRIFICQWREIGPLSSSGSKALTHQILLYENGAIEIHYKQETANVSWGSASISLNNSTTDWQCLPSSGTNPIPSTTTYTSTITARPADGQSYLWGITTRGYNNASVSGMTAPTYPFCGGVHNVNVTLKNTGKNQINNVKIYWELDGVLQPVVNYNNLIDTFGSVNGNQVTATIGSVNFSGPDRTLKIWTSIPNGVADTVNGDDTLLIKRGPAPKVGVTPDGPTVFCTAGTINVKLSAPAGAGSIYQWLRDGSPIPGATNSSYQATIAGDYTVRIDSNGCQNTSAITRVDNLAMPLPLVHPAGYPVLCSGDTIVLVANAGITGASYQWQFQGANIIGATNASLTVVSPGNYTVITSKYVCTASSPGITVVAAQAPTPLISEQNGTLMTGNTYVDYQWAVDGTDIPGATSFAHKPTKPGNYTVRVSNGGCDGTSPAYPVGSTSISNINNAVDGLVIYPNPAKDYVYINTTDPITVSISSVEGKVILQQNVVNQKLDISALPAGMYIVKVANNDGIVIKTDKLLKRD